jgi:hypothetical protein
MTEVPHRSSQRSRQKTWLGLFACLVLLIVSGAADAHGSAVARSPVDSPALSQHVAVSAAGLFQAADEHSCPSGSGHRQHQACASSGICHAMAIAQGVALAPSTAEARLEPAVAAAISSGNVAPPFHPPKSLHRF